MQAKHDTTMYCYRACICNEDYYNSEPLQLMQSIHVFCICVDSFFSFVSEHQKYTQFIMRPSTQSLIQSFPLTHSIPLTISNHRFTDSLPGYLPLPQIFFVWGPRAGFMYRIDPVRQDFFSSPPTCLYLPRLAYCLCIPRFVPVAADLPILA